jgi:hypothetical protein
MNHSDQDLFRFCSYCDLSGTPHRISRGKRNGRPVAFFAPTALEPVEPAAEPIDYSEQSRLFVNLNALESATWKRLLTAQSIASIAKEDGVSRAAIYARIEGNGTGQGGMTAKNFWVLLWWRLRERQKGKRR